MLKAMNSSGEASDLRLWIVDLEGFSWIVMPNDKAREHGLDGARVELLREGELRCVETMVTSDRETVTTVRDARYERYAIQRLATSVGIFTREPGPDATRSSCELRCARTDNGAHSKNGTPGRIRTSGSKPDSSDQARSAPRYSHMRRWLSRRASPRSYPTEINGDSTAGRGFSAARSYLPKHLILKGKWWRRRESNPRPLAWDRLQSRFAGSRM